MYYQSKFDIIKRMKFLLAAVISTPLIIWGLFSIPHSLGQTQTASMLDFTAAVQVGLQSLAINPIAQFQQQEIINQDYKSSWDEFGINTLIDGNTLSAEVNNLIDQDIIQSIETAQSYNQQEESYLQDTQITPEQVQNIESSTGADVSPSESFDPNPSVDTNPDVNTSPADTPTQDTTGTNKNENSTQDTNAPTQGATNPTQDTNNPTTETSTSQPSSNILQNENTIFNAILHSEQDHVIDQTPASPEITPTPTSPGDNTSTTP